MLEKLDFSTSSVLIYHDSFVQLDLKLPLMSIYLLSKTLSTRYSKISTYKKDKKNSVFA